MTFFRPENLRTILDGRWLAPPSDDAAPRGLGIDTRQELAGRAYIAIRGQQHDGHAFLHEAAARGASMLIVDQDLPGARLPPAVAVLRIDDTRRGLIRLAAAYRSRWRGTRVIAVTGSAGKTTTRSLIHQVLATSLRGSESAKSFNNDIGVPLTLLAVQPGDDYLVLEVGSNAPGEIAALADLARPDIAVIVSVGRAHLQKLGSVEGVAAEKASLLKALRPSGLAVVNADAPALRPHLAGVEPLVRFGLAPDADLCLTARGHDQQGWWMEVNGSSRFHLGLPGEHNAVNALAAIVVARHVGIAEAKLAQALAAAQLPAMRMTRQTIGSLDIYDDAYNANPDSMRASLATFAELAAAAPRRVVVLGDMLELGHEGPRLHRELGQALLDIDRRAPIAVAILIGPLARHAAEPLLARWTADRVLALPALTEDALDAIARVVQSGDSVLLKGSRAMAVESVLVDWRRRQEPPVPGRASLRSAPDIAGTTSCAVS